ncbi:MAG: type IV secretory system conjugative DNA transfer family protein [Bacteroidia bacterium]
MEKVNRILETIFSILTQSIEAFIDFLSELFPEKRKTEFNADFVSPESILRRNGKGFCLNGKLCMTVEESFRNCLVLGGTGSGKSSIVLICSALKMALGNSSLIFHDVSHELRILLSGFLRSSGFEIKILNYNHLKSECFNPLLRCKSISDIQKLASSLIRNSIGESSHDKFWNISAESLLSLFIRYLIFYADEKYHTLYNLLHLINVFAGSPETIDALIVKTGDEKLLSEYKAFVAYGDKTLMSIVATAKSALSLYSDETVAMITSMDTIDFNEFRTRKIALFINNSVPDMHYYGRLSSLFFQQFFNYVLNSKPKQTDNNIYLLLDEASSMFLPSLSNIISNIRKYNSGIMLVYQDAHQIDNIYGSYEAKNITANCYAKVYLPGQPIETCKMLEATLGKFEYEDEEEVKHIRNLMSADEIRMSDRAIILLGNKPPIHSKLYPYYEDRKLKTLTEYPPVSPSNNLPFDSPPLLPISK